MVNVRHNSMVPIFQACQHELDHDLTRFRASVPACRVFKAPGPYWGRHYVFWHNGKPLTLIYEVFSTALEQYLGPSGHNEA